MMLIMPVFESDIHTDVWRDGLKNSLRVWPMNKLLLVLAAVLSHCKINEVPRKTGLVVIDAKSLFKNNLAALRRLPF